MFPLRDDRPHYSAPVVTSLLMVACVLVFFFELMLSDYSRSVVHGTVRRGAGSPAAHFAVHIHVPARRLEPHYRQYAVSVGLREKP